MSPSPSPYPPRGRRVAFATKLGPPAEPPRPASADAPKPEWADLRRIGKRLLRNAITSARADDAPTLSGLLTSHIGPEAGSMPVVSSSWAPYEHVNLQLAIDHWLAAEGRQSTLVGIIGFQHRMFTLADLAQGTSAQHGPWVGAVAMTQAASGPDGATRACVRCGLYLVHDDVPVAILLREAEPRGGQEQTSVEVLCADQERAAALLAELREMALRHSVFRGQVLSFGEEVFGPRSAPLTFHERPALDRESLVLPPGVLDMVETQVMGVAEHRRRLTASGQHLKRGVLLHGPPGTGKTHTLRYLMSVYTGATVVLLSGDALRFISDAVSIARSLQPAVVIVEDVDLIAEERGMAPGQHPLLFQLLNEMDGLDDDADVTFLLTTNRADLLEPALAQRPGRVDQAVELPLPDADGRLRLIRLYRGELDLRLDDPEPIISRTEGMTASFFKELLRRAALIAASDDTGNDTLTVTDTELGAALETLFDERNTLTRTLLSGSEQTSPPPGPPVPGVNPRPGWYRA